MTCATCRHWRLDPEYPNARMRDCVAIGHEFGYREDDGQYLDGRSNETGKAMSPNQVAESVAIIRPGDPYGPASVLRTAATFGCPFYTIAAV